MQDQLPARCSDFAVKEVMRAFVATQSCSSGPLLLGRGTAIHPNCFRSSAMCQQRNLNMAHQIWCTIFTAGCLVNTLPRHVSTACRDSTPRLFSLGIAVRPVTFSRRSPSTKRGGPEGLGHSSDRLRNTPPRPAKLGRCCLWHNGVRDYFAA